MVSRHTADRLPRGEWTFRRNQTHPTLGSENGGTMVLRIVRAGAGVLLGASGGLMYAASWERWADACPWSGGQSGACEARESDEYDFLPPTAPWEPVGSAAEFAGWSLLVLALAFVLLPWALTARRPGLYSGVALVGVVLALGAMGVTLLRVGLSGSVVPTVGGDSTSLVWGLVLPCLLVWFAVVARGWARAAAVSLVLATPLAAALSYAIGSYDSRPWWEGISGILTTTGGVCLLVAAASSSRSRTPADAAHTAPPAGAVHSS
jgi:hypothetical protein